MFILIYNGIQFFLAIIRIIDYCHFSLLLDNVRSCLMLDVLLFRLRFTFRFRFTFTFRFACIFDIFTRRFGFVIIASVQIRVQKILILRAYMHSNAFSTSQKRRTVHTIGRSYFI